MATASLIMETSAFALPNAGEKRVSLCRMLPLWSGSQDVDLTACGVIAAVRSSATKKRQDEWDTAYVVDVTVVVDCDDSVQAYKSGLSGWKIEFALPVDTKISKIWNAHLDREGSRCTVLHEKFCSPVCRGRAVLYFGFEAKPADPKKRASVPPTFLVNGQVCGVTASYARDLADCYYDYLFESRPCSRSPSPEPTYSRSPSPEAREASLPPSNESDYQISAPMFNNKRVRDSSPSAVADCRDTKKVKTTRQAEDDEEKSVAQTPPRNFSPIEDCEVSDETPLGSHYAHSPKGSDCVAQPESELTAPADDEPDTPPSTTLAKDKYPRTLEIDYYRRSKALKERKYLHMDYLDTCFKSREEVILSTVLDQDSIVLEPNMFPYDCPPGVTHWTLWSKDWLTEDGITAFVNNWLSENMSGAIEWNHDDNMSDGLSINLFHIHVYIRCPV
eukprot:656735-Rhodomonas_salina.1